MVSWRSRIAERGVRWLIRSEPKSAEEAVAQFRRALGRLHLPTIPVAGITESKAEIAGVPCLILTPETPANTLLYVHGGGFVAGRPHTYRNIGARLAKRLDARVVLPDYRKAPEHPYPAAPDDVLAVYSQLLDDGQEPRRLLLAGDSAGGSIALATLIGARDAGLPQPAGCAVLSPSTDQTWINGSHLTNNHCDPMLSQAMIERLHECYVIDPARRGESRASPALADWSDCAPLIIVVSRSECLHDHSLRLAARAREAGVSVTLREEDGRMHVWPALAPFLPESVATLGWLGDAMAEMLPA